MTSPPHNCPTIAPDCSRPITAYDSDFWIVDADGRNDRRLTFSSGTDNHPRWSPDGTRIAFLSDRAGRMAIFAIDPGFVFTGIDERPTLSTNPREFAACEAQMAAVNHVDGPDPQR